MEQQQRSLFFTAAVGLIILAIIVGSIYYLVKFIQTRISSSSTTEQTENIAGASTAPASNNSREGVISIDDQTSGNTGLPTTGSTKGGVAADSKTYQGAGFQISYPSNWGLLTCTNSTNVEFDPSSNTDQKISCNYAVKPVTILVDSLWNCAGDTTTLGNVQVVKSKKGDASYTQYHWCTKTTPVLNITHRVSNQNDPASSKEDYSAKIEEMISKLTFTSGS